MVATTILGAGSCLRVARPGWPRHDGRVVLELVTGAVEPLRRQVQEAIRVRVAGPEPEARAVAVELVSADGPRWFAPGSPVWVVHSDVAMFVGGLRALLLQSLHPLAMAGVAAHSDYRHDPWGRLQRTGRFLALTTYGTAEQAEEACAVVRAVHERVRGTASDGRPYAATDPHLLAWVHLAEVESFLLSHRRYGHTPLNYDERDEYVAQMGRVARALGVLDPPDTVAELRRQLARYRPELRSTPAARASVRFLLNPPDVPLVARPAYGLLYASAATLLPVWARVGLRLPWLPVTERVVVRPAAQLLVDSMRWVLGPPPTAA